MSDFSMTGMYESDSDREYYEKGMPTDALEPIAIIGIAARLPQDATCSTAFWEMLQKGRSGMTEIPPDRFRTDSFYHPDGERLDTLNVRGGHFLRDDITKFDAPFFSISRTEAESLDPQQRGLLECTYHVLENAGIPLQEAEGTKTGVFVGSFAKEYDALFSKDPSLQPKYQASGTGSAMLSNRLSWFYNFHGPSITLDTACSSSLIALHLAVQSLRAAESTMAVVAGSNILLNPDAIMMSLSNLQFLSPDGLCYSFDHRANGYSRGEGFGAILLKPLSKALEDNDTIRAVIRATGSNQDGRTPGLTQPSEDAQARLIRETYSSGGLNLEDTRFFEAHGTGTPIGDPTEARAIHSVFGKFRSPQEPLIIGAVKSNIGHLEGASGLASIIKTVMVLENGVIPPNTCFEKPPPTIPVDEWNIKFPTENMPWPTDGLRRASVNSFGYGGANAHVVLDDAYNYLNLRHLKGRHRTARKSRVVPPVLEMLLEHTDLAISNDVPDSTPEDSLNGSSSGSSNSFSREPTPDGLHPSDLNYDTRSVSSYDDCSADLSLERTASNDCKPKILVNGHAIRRMSNGNSDVSNNDCGAAPSASNLQTTKLLIISASDEAGPERMAETLFSHISSLTKDGSNLPAGYMRDLAYTLASKRTKFPWKSYSVVDGSLNDTTDLQNLCSKPVRSSGTAPGLAFIFTGQGAAWYAMGRELLENEVFRSNLLSSSEYLVDLGCTWSIIEELQRSKIDSNLTSPAFSQPICTALQIALTYLLESWNVIPSSVVGHSSGEIAAAFCAGALSHRDSMKAAYYRGTLSAKIADDSTRPPETMMAVAVSQAETEGYMRRVIGRGALSIACVNSPKGVTVSGSIEAVEELRQMLEADDIFARRLNIDVAYHSPTMNDLADDYLALLGSFDTPDNSSRKAPLPKMFSSVSGELISHKELARGEYWVRNMVSKVEFSAALSSMEQSKSTPSIAFALEVGPTGALRRSVLDTLPTITYDSILKIDRSAHETSMSLAGTLWSHGVPVNLNSVNGLVDSNVSMLTDLPPYPFNHTRSYWHESRLSKNFRFRKHARHELLGTQVNDWNPLEAKWRNTISARENPWIRDHGFNGSQLYPASGMMVMAIEAARQVGSDEKGTVKGYRVKDVTFSRALVLSDNEAALETEFFLRSREADHAATSQWSDFRLCSLSNGEWVENCKGTIIIEYETAAVEVDNGFEHAQAQLRQLEMHEERARNCTIGVGSKQMYDNLSGFGFDFGPTFRTLNDVSFSGNGEATASINLYDWKSKLPPQIAHIQEHLIHPVPLDGLLHLTVTAFSRGGWKPIPTMVPTYVQDLWISHKFLSDPDIQSVSVSSRSKSSGFREAEFDMIATDLEQKEVLITIDAYRATAVSSLNATSSTDSWRRLCFRPSWKLDVGMASKEALAQHCNEQAALVVQPSVDAIDEAELTCLYFISNALKVIDSQDSVLEPHLQKYFQWMKRHFQHDESARQMLESEAMKRLLSDAEYKEAFLSRIETSGPEGKVYVTVGRHLISILLGEVDVLSMLFEDGLLQEFYSGSAFTANYERMRTYVDLLAHKTPNMSVLEIGAGTGGATAPVLRALGPQDPEDRHSTARYQEYVYTDISAGFFEAAKQRFDSHASRMSFKTLDIEKDPLKQGYENKRYDLVVASCVLHATSEIDATLKHTRALVKPGGKLLLFEPCQLDCARLSFVFGLLPGWWLSKEKSRQWTPLLSDISWDDALRRNGFSGTDVCIRDQEGERHTFSVMVSTAADENPRATIRSQTPEVIITVRPDSFLQDSVSKDIVNRLQTIGMLKSTVVSFPDLSEINTNGGFCISLLELEDPFLCDINEEDFSIMKKATQTLQYMLWVSSEGSGVSRKPLMGAATGFARSMCSENESLNFITLLTDGVISPASLADNIFKILQSSVDAGSQPCEQEYRSVEGQLCINRVVEANPLNDDIHKRTITQEPELRAFGQEPRRALTLTTSSPGLLSALQFVDDPEERPLGPEDVELEVRAVGMNFKNVMVALGQIPGTSLGQECSGVITRLGTGISRDQLSIGDRVCCLSVDGFKTFARCHISSVYRIPAEMSLATAAAVPVAFCTAYYSLIYLARIQPGESVLINVAAGGVGQAAVQIAKHRNAEIYATVGSEEKKTLLMDLYDIPNDHIFSSRHSSFAQGIKRMTNGRGVDVVLNSLSGELLKHSVDCVAPLGRFVEIGKKDMFLRNELSMSLFLNNIAFFSVDLGIIADKAQPLMQEIMNGAMGLVTETNSQMHAPQPLTQYPVSQLEEAYRSLQSGKNSGKVVIELGANDQVMTVPSTKPTWYFDPNATYVIAGGTGGLGRSVARWMVSRKAKYIILLSRSGSKVEAATELISELAKVGATVVAPPCDICDENVLRTILMVYSTILPPVKGCIQGSMVLRDGLFENMTHDNFHAALRPKVQGTWNLHATLPSNMDFFVLLSSTGGVFGSRGQSNYAAASTYQDAFARYRVSQGEKCISLDVGLMLEVGFAAERQNITDSLVTAGYEGIHESEFLAMLDEFCDPALPLQSPDNTQIITGISTPQSLASKGLGEIFWMSKPIFQGLRQMDRAFAVSEHRGESATNYRLSLEQAATQEEAGRVIADALKNKLSAALSMPSADIEIEKPTYAYGVDSLVAVEIRYWFLKEFNAQIAVFEILRSESIAALSFLVASKTQYQQRWREGPEKDSEENSDVM